MAYACVLKCGEKHCVRCYLLTSCHTIHTISIVRREERMKMEFIFIVSHGMRWQNSIKFHKMAQTERMPLIIQTVALYNSSPVLKC